MLVFLWNQWWFTVLLACNFFPLFFITKLDNAIQFRFQLFYFLILPANILWKCSPVWVVHLYVIFAICTSGCFTVRRTADTVISFSLLHVLDLSQSINHLLFRSQVDSILCYSLIGFLSFCLICFWFSKALLSHSELLCYSDLDHFFKETTLSRDYRI